MEKSTGTHIREHQTIMRHVKHNAQQVVQRLRKFMHLRMLWKMRWEQETVIFHRQRRVRVLEIVLDIGTLQALIRIRDVSAPKVYIRRRHTFIMIRRNMLLTKMKMQLVRVPIEVKKLKLGAVLIGFFAQVLHQTHLYSTSMKLVPMACSSDDLGLLLISGWT